MGCRTHAAPLNICGCLGFVHPGFAGWATVQCLYSCIRYLEAKGSEESKAGREREMQKQKGIEVPQGKGRKVQMREKGGEEVFKGEKWKNRIPGGKGDKQNKQTNKTLADKEKRRNETKGRETNSWQKQRLLSIAAEYFSVWKSYFRCGGGKLNRDPPIDLRWEKLLAGNMELKRKKERRKIRRQRDKAKPDRAVFWVRQSSSMCRPSCSIFLFPGLLDLGEIGSANSGPAEANCRVVWVFFFNFSRERVSSRLFGVM